LSALPTVARETAAALGDLLLAAPRHLLGLAGAAARREAFAGLAHDDLPALDEDAPPARPLRRVLLSCGDVSGEAHALRLLEELRARHPALEVAGFGGEKLRAAGMEVWEPLADLNVMGFRDVAAQLPLFFRCVARFTRELRERRPDWSTTRA
jgi:hypothetical protein